MSLVKRGARYFTMKIFSRLNSLPEDNLSGILFAIYQLVVEICWILG